MKKLSTFLTVSLLAGAVSTAHAADPVYAKHTANGTAVLEIKADGLYQLETNTAGTVMAMVEQDGEYVLIADSKSGKAELRYTLWTITAKNDGVGNYSYSFVNYGTGLPLTINTNSSEEASAGSASYAAVVGGTVGAWKWLKAPSSSTNLAVATLSATFGAKSDSVVYLVGGTNIIGSMKTGTTEAAPSKAIQLRPVAAAPVLLGKDDLNSMLWAREDASEGVKFTFDKDVEGSKIGNLFTKQSYTATDAVGYPFKNWTTPTTTISDRAMEITAKNTYEIAVHKAELAQAVADALGTTDAEVTKYAPVALAFSNGMSNSDEVNNASSIDALITNIETFANIKTNETEVAVEEAVRAAWLKYVKAEGHLKNLASVTVLVQSIHNGTGSGVINKVAASAVTTVTSLKAAVAEYTDAVTADKAAMTSEETSNRTAVKTNGWLSLKASDGKYLMVDTAYLTSTPGNEMLGFATKAFKDVTTNSAGIALANDDKTRLDLNGRYNFQFLWYPENDSISVRVAGYSKLTDDKNGSAKYYRDMDLTTFATTLPTATTQTNVAGVGNKELNLIKLAALASGHTEVTVGSSAFAGTNNWTVNTKISINGSSKYNKTTIDEGVYLIQYVSDLAKNAKNNGKYYVGGILENIANDGLAVEDVQNFADMPSAQWIVLKDKNTDRYTIENREDSTKLGSFENAYIYDAGAKDQISLLKGDTIKMTKLTGDAVTAQNVGYLGGSNSTDLKETKFALNYFNAIDATKFVNMTKDSSLVIDIEGEKVYFTIDSIGYTQIHQDKKDVNGKVIVKGIKKNKYQLYVAEKNAPAAERLYIYKTTDGKGYRLNTTTAAGNAKPDSFYIVEWNSKATELKAETAATKYYALFDAKDGNTKVGVKDNTLALTVEASTEVRTSAFALVSEPAPEYRHLGVTIEDGIAKDDTAYVELFMSKEPTRFLYENTQNRVADNGTKVAADSLNYLGVYNKADLTRNASIFVDTAYINHKDNTKPLYMLASAAEYTPAVADDTCKIHGKDCEHSKLGKAAYITGRYLVALNDSTDNKSAYYQGSPRLAFVDAIHSGDTLYVGAKKFVLSDGMNNATFAFRLVDDGAEADFYIEANKGQYVRVHNGVPVLVNELSDAATFNIKKSEVVPTANEEIATEGVKVIAGEGFVTVKGAAGKKVVIANVLGQTVANTVVASDEAQIAAPAGVVIVAVEGEAAVKAIVK